MWYFPVRASSRRGRSGILRRVRCGSEHVTGPVELRCACVPDPRCAVLSLAPIRVKLRLWWTVCYSQSSAISIHRRQHDGGSDGACIGIRS